MAQTEIKARVRPIKAAILIPDTATADELSLAVRFLSRIWGGRHCPILPVAQNGADPRGIRWLAQTRPDFVFGLSVDEAAWHDAARKTCQHRAYRSLTRELVESLHLAQSRFKLPTAMPAVQRRRLNPGPPRRRSLQLVRAEEGFALAPYVSVLFGDCDPQWGKDTIHLPESEPTHWFKPENTVVDFIEFVSTFLMEWRESWLDLASDGLSVMLESMGTPATIVAVGSAVDLALAWNLRTGESGYPPVWVIPVPVDDLCQEPVQRALRDWIGTMKKFDYTPNFCEVVSLTVPADRLRGIADGLRACMDSEGIVFVDPFAPVHEVPSLVAFNHEQMVAVDITDRVLSVTALPPDVAEFREQRGAWLLDLIRDERTRRCVGELYLVPRPCVQEVINVPPPPSLPSSGNMPIFGFREDTINAYCTKEKEIIRLCLPTAEELLLEVLMESDIRPKYDEKRTAYLPALEVLGGLQKAAHSFKGRLRQVVQVLERKKIADLATILNEAKLGRGTFHDELGKPDHLNRLLRQVSDVARRVALKRFDEHWKDFFPDDTKLKTLLGHWAERGILTRGERGYALEPDLQKAVGEGLIPVALTGDFLKRMTNLGFLWLPGVKYEKGGIHADIDILASCDGALVLAECKDMEGTPVSALDWEREVWPQFEELIEAAKACRADLVILASLADAFPDGWLERAKSKAGDSLAVLLLTRQDLDDGFREVPRIDDMPSHHMGFNDILVQPERTLIRRDPPGQRTIRSSSFVMHYGG